MRPRTGGLALLLLLAAVPLNFAGPALATPVSGVISVDTTWTLAGSPYTIDGHVYVTANALLTIEAGVEVNATGYYGLFVGEGGRVLVDGTLFNPVRFTAAGPSPGSWIGIQLNASAGPSDLHNASVERAEVGVRAYRSALLDRVEFSRNVVGLQVTAASGVNVTRSTFRWQTISAVILDGGADHNRIERSLFEENNETWQGGVFLGASGGGNIIRLSTFHRQTLAIGVDATNPLDPDRFEWNNFEADSRDNTGDPLWNGSYAVGGNFWTGYPGVDALSGPAQDQPGPDGFGDTSRAVPASYGGVDARDFFPRMCARLDAYPDALTDAAAPSINAFSVPATVEWPQPAVITANLTDSNLCLGGGYVNITLPGGTWTNRSMDAAGGEFGRTFVPTLFGTHGVDLWAIDAGGNVAHASGTFLVQDTTPPSITGVSGQLSVSGGTYLDLGATITDNHQLVAVTGNVTDPLGAVTAFTPGSTGPIYSHTLQITEPGTYGFCFTATDFFGLTRSACSSTDFVDTWLPGIALLYATPSPAEVPVDVQVGVTVSDNALYDPPWLRVLDPIGGVTNVTMTPVAADHYRRTFAATLVGPYGFEAWVRDNSGNFNVTAGVVTATDTTPPSLSPLFPPRVPVGTTVFFDASASTDNTGIAGAWWNFTDGGPVSLPGLTAAYNFAALGTYTISLEAEDAYGNGASRTDPLIVEVDDPPTVTATATPAVGEVPAPIRIAASITDDFAVAGAWADVTGPGPVNLTLSWNATAAQYEAVWALPALGAHSVTVWAADDAGQWSSDATSFVSQDTTPPVISDVQVTASQDQTANYVLLVFAALDNSLVIGGTAEFRASNGTVLVNATLSPQSSTHWGVRVALKAAGDFTYCATVQDLVGLTATTCGGFTITDTRSPVFLQAELSPTTPQASAPVFIGVVVDDNVGVVSVWANVSGVTLTPTNVSGTGRTYTTSTAVLGPHVVNITAVDAAGQSTSILLTFTVIDTLPPIAVAGADVSIALHGNVSLDASGSWDGSGIVNHTWTLPAALGGGQLFGPSHLLTVHSVGTFTVLLEVRDLVGLVGADTLVITVADPTPPVLSGVIAPATVPYGTAFSLTARASDNDRVAAVHLVVTVGLEVVNVTATDLGGGNWSAVYSPAAPGDFPFRVLARDPSLNWVELTGAFVSQDLVRPQIVFPSLGALSAPSFVPVTATVTDNHRVQNVWLHVRDPSNTPANGTMFDTGSGWSAGFTATLPGAYTITVWAVDFSGNFNSSSQVAVAADTVPPTILTLSFPSPSPVSRAIPVEANVTDNADSAAVLDIRLVVTDPLGIVQVLSLNPIGGAAFRGTLTPTYAGAYLLRLVANDSAGNSAVRTASFTATDSVPPTVGAFNVTQTVTDPRTTLTLTVSVSDDGPILEAHAALQIPGGAVLQNLSLSTAPGLQVVFFNVTIGGAYEVRVWVRDAAGNGGLRVERVEVATGRPPVAVAGTDLTVPVGATVTLDGTNSTDDFGIVSYDWEVVCASGTTFAQGAVQSHTFGTPGTCSVRLTVTDAAGRSDWETFSVFVPDPNTGGGGGAVPWWLLLIVFIVGIVAVWLWHVYQDWRTERKAPPWRRFLKP